MTVGHGIFILIVVLALSFFSYNAQRLVRYMMSIGQPEIRTDDPVTRLKNLFLIGLAQKKILRDAVAGPLHASVFWGFVVLTVGTAEIIVQGLFPGFTYAAILPAPLYDFYILSQELFAVLVLAAVAVLLYRRIIVKPRRLQGDKVHSGDAILILSMIGALMVSLITLGAFGFALHPESGTIFQPVSLAVSHAFGGLSAGTLELGRETSWWFHALLILVFLNYLPYSKHLHVLTSLPNTYLANTSGPGVKGAMSYMDLEAEGAEQFGASDVTHLGWKSLLDSYSCTECGRCTAVCPANITGKLLSPRKIMINTRQRLMELAPLATGDFGEFEHHTLAAGEGGDAGHSNGSAALGNTLLDNYITEEELWACTSCRACVEECPVSIDQLDIINELRRGLVLMESRFPPEIQPAFESLEKNGSPWAFDPGDRAKWAEGMDIPTMAEMVERGERPEVLFWVGCMGSFDDRAKKIAVAFARVLQAANVKFAILGQEEKCNGDPARRMGNEYLYQMLARDNIETLDRYGVETIVTNCPHCFHQIGNEYPQLGGNYDVIHHSTYIEKLMDENRLPLNGEGKALTVAYHDSCYLGRYNGIYEAPRETMKRALPMMTLVEPPRNRSKGLCCGAGGGRMWMEETVGKRINVERTEELLATGADVLAVACPFCMTMIGDGVKAQDSSVQVLDISEVIAQQLVH
ncbi:MAG: (Fe-S)-binding protein [Gemmatimonadaceae bacterium]